MRFSGRLESTSKNFSPIRRRLARFARSRLRPADFDVGDGGGGFGDREAVLQEAFEVEGAGFVDVAFCLRWRRAGGYAAGEAGIAGRAQK